MQVCAKLSQQLMYMLHMSTSFVHRNTILLDHPNRTPQMPDASTLGTRKFHSEPVFLAIDMSSQDLSILHEDSVPDAAYFCKAEFHSLPLLSVTDICQWGCWSTFAHGIPNKFKLLGSWSLHGFLSLCQHNLTSFALSEGNDSLTMYCTICMCMET